MKILLVLFIIPTVLTCRLRPSFLPVLYKREINRQPPSKRTSNLKYSLKEQTFREPSENLTYLMAMVSFKNSTVI